MKNNASVVQGHHAMVQPFTVAEPVNEFGETFNGEKGSFLLRLDYERNVLES